MNFKIWSPLSVVSDEILNETRLAHVSGREAFLVTNADEVLTFGTNTCGCLGLNDTEPRFSPQSVAALRKKQVKGFSVCGNQFGKSTSTFVIAHCFTGAVYMWGKNHGTGDADPVLKPTLMNQMTTKVIAVACGWEHCLLLNSDGEVFAWGGNTKGQLGINSKKQSAVPTKIEEQLGGKFVTKISCGVFFSVALLDSGEVFAWGSNKAGQLGVNETDNNCTVPKKVFNLKDTVITKITCGSSYVLAMSDVCELYVWGSNSAGELGLGDRVPRIFPVKNESIGRIRKIATSCREYTSAALTENFRVFMWGNCAGLNLVAPRETPYESLHEVFSNFSITMHKSMTRQPDVESVNETLGKAFGDKETSDLTILIEGKEIFVHRSILRLRSDYFRTFLQDHWIAETVKCSHIILDRSYDVMYAYLKYLYCGKLKVEPKLALELMALADEYNDGQLKRLCEKTVQYGITVDNVASLYAIAVKLNGKKLLKNCFSFAANHMSELIATSGFDGWDVNVMKEFFRECLKRKLFRT